LARKQLFRFQPIALKKSAVGSAEGRAPAGFGERLRDQVSISSGLIGSILVSLWRFCAVAAGRNLTRSDPLATQESVERVSRYFAVEFALSGEGFWLVRLHGYHPSLMAVGRCR
jgi:hypothetical protein